MDQQIDLSILIPARNEEFLDRTIQDVIEHSKSNIEIIVTLDGYLPNPPLHPDPRVTIIYNPVSVGQRAATNQGAKLAKGKYVMKIDAHVALDDGYDVKMLEAFKKVGDNVTMIPGMRNLHCFDLVCPDGHRRYQGPSGPCEECGKPTVKDVIWFPKPSPFTFTFRFDKTMHFQYWGELAKREENHKGALCLDGSRDPMLRETMSIQGSCFMLTREKYFELDICSEDFHSWGQQGVEVACKTWLSGGAVIANIGTWYAHMFRTRGGDFGFPYRQDNNKVSQNRELSRELFQRNKWPQAIHTFQWLLDKFDPPEWNVVNDKGIIYYTDNELRDEIAKPCRDQLIKVAKERKLPIVTAALHKKLDFGVNNIYFPSLKRGMLTQFKQILSALEHITTDVVFFCEADILYHSSHFDFTPPSKEVYYYNVNVWKVRWDDGHALKVNELKQLSGLCGNREFLIQHYKKRIAVVEQRIKDMEAQGIPIENQGVSHYMGFEPGMESKPRGVDEYPTEAWRSEYPNIDIRHDRNISKNRWKKEEFQDQIYTEGWTESTADKIPGWEELLPTLLPTPPQFSVNSSPTKGMIYYTTNQLDDKIATPVRDILQKISDEKNIPIVSSSLKKMNFGVKNVRFPSLKRGYLTLFKQILGALENSDADIIFFTEHDVLYDPSHFDFEPKEKDVFYYNQNVWYLRPDGHALHYDVNQLSGLCVYREAAITHFRERYEMAVKAFDELDESEFYRWVRNMGFEPMTHGRISWNNQFKYDIWKSERPNIDIRFGINSTGMRWNKDQYRNQQLLINWQETDDEITGWGKTSDIVKTLQ